MNINLQYEKTKASIYDILNNSNLPACLIKEMINGVAQQVNYDYDSLLQRINAEEARMPQEDEEVE